ncbi:MAG: DUF1801 domain-containing protein [Anaerolineaceae bacterium]|nr:DUF1801 domain-containing protein [Anaerolineaceae bacterium]
MKAFENPEVAAVFNRYPKKMQTKLLFLRQFIFETAAKTEGVGELEETLKWGQPAYLTTKSKSGSTIRIDRSSNTKFAMYVHCQTALIETFKLMFPNEFTYEGNRGIIFDIDDDIPVEKLSVCISLALTYHRSKKKRVYGKTND